MAEYREYKDSGIPWIGRIPSHWITRRAKFIFDRHKRPVRPIDEIVTCFRDGVVTLRKNRRESGFTNALMEFGYQGIRKGDLIVHQMDAFAGSIGVSDSDGKSTPVYTVCTMRNDDSITWYYAFLLRVMAKTDFIQSLSRGIRERSTAFGYDIMGNLLLPIPPKEEQEAIVAYLDKATADIDKAIAAKERIIASLEERRKIIITHAVTRGINPDAQMKDSGIDWLGEIPAHWDCTKLKYFIRIKSGDSISNSDLSENGQYVVYGGGEPLGRYDRFNVSCGAIIVGRVGARCGCVTPIHQDVWATDNALVITPDGISMEYLSYILIAADLNKLASTNAQPLLTGSKVKNTFFALPPIKEQQSILQYIESQTIKIDSAVAHQKRLIELLRERKNIIINETVTGKVKVI